MNGNIYCIIDAFNIDDFITNETLETKLSGYVTTATLNNYVTTETLNNYVEKASFVYDSSNKTLDIRIL